MECAVCKIEFNKGISVTRKSFQSTSSNSALCVSVVVLVLWVAFFFVFAHDVTSNNVSVHNFWVATNFGNMRL